MQRLKIDFVSDVACPWCAIGLGGLIAAVDRLAGKLEVELTFQPFELNRNMPPEGENLGEHLVAKYELTAAQIADSNAQITALAAEAGYTFNLTRDSRIWNTFDAHRLMYWAESHGDPLMLQNLLFKANFTDQRSISDHAVLAELAVEAGLNGDRAKEILASETYLDEVDERMKLWLSKGIRGVPAIIINDRHIIEGGQSSAVFEQALLQIAAASAEPA